MAGLSSASSATQSAVPGTNVPPISFPGIVSGIDYNSIITKLTSLTLLPTTQYNQEITQINSKNSELIKINSLLTSVQNSLNALSNPSTFAAFTGSTSDPAVLTATANGQGAASPGSYTIDSTQLATASSVTGAVSSSTGHSMTDVLTSDSINPSNDGKASNTVPLDESFAAITPTNGGNQRGQVTIDGQAISYDVGSDSLQTIVANINAAVQLATVDPGFTATYNATTDEVTFSSTDQQISLGSQSDRGNLLSVLKLDVAQVNNTANSGSVTSAGAIGGINQATTFTGANFAGLVTPLTGTDGSFFTINGVHITINPSTDNLAGVVANINSSAAGVVATYNTVTNQVTLTSKSTGPQGIVLGSVATGDTSNFLSAVGLTSASGGTSSVGQQAKVVLTSPSGAVSSFFSNSNSIASAIPGINLNIFQTTTTPQTVTITQDSSVAIAAINTFASAYNAAINEIDAATAPPVIEQDNADNTVSLTTSTSQAVSSGGILYGDFSIVTLKNQLIDLAESIVQNGNTSFQSLSAIGLNLDTSESELSASNAATPGTVTSGPVTVTQTDGTSGAFTALDLTTFNAAYSADPQVVQSIFNAADGIVSGFGNYLTSITGLPTTTANGLVGTIPSTSFIQNDENSNSSQITSLQDFITTLQDEANMQADTLRAQFTASETLIAGFQAVAGQVSQLNSGL